MFVNGCDHYRQEAGEPIAGSDLPFLLTVPHASGALPHWREDIRHDPVWNGHLAGSHHALDRGAADLARAVQGGLSNAVTIEGDLSRLVIDLNRPLDTGEAIPLRAGTQPLTFNEGIRPGDHAARRFRHHSFHYAIAAALAATGGRSFLVDMHSFDRKGDGVFLRGVDIGICAPEDDLFASLVEEALHADPACCRYRIMRDQPYSAAHPGAYVTRRHQGASAGCTVIETCDDLLHDAAEVAAIAGLLIAALCQAAAAITTDPQSGAALGENT